MEKDNFTQVDYDLEMNKLRAERNMEYRSIDQRKVTNAHQMDFLRQQMGMIKQQINDLHTSNKQIEADKNAIARKWNEKQVALLQRRNNCIAPNKEISSTVAYRLHCAVEKALKAVLAPFPNVNLEAIKCNYNYDDGGGISFDVIIPTYDEGKADQA